MKRILILIFCLMLSGCAKSEQKIENMQIETKEEEAVYMNITAEEAKRIMDTEEEFVILDVREQSEYDEGHIEGAILIPHEKIKEMAEEKIPDKETLILVYCRSGRRSRIASEALLELGYTNIKEFGGIIDWEYGVVR